MNRTSDSGGVNQDSDYARQIQEALDELSQRQQSPQWVTNPAALEAWEGTIRGRTDHLGSLLVATTCKRAWILRTCRGSKTCW